LVAATIIAGMVGLYLATFWIKKEGLWGAIHKSVAGAMAAVIVLLVVATCAESVGRRDDPLIERTYRR